MPELLRSGIQSTHIWRKCAVFLYFFFFLCFILLIWSSCNIAEKSIAKLMSNEWRWKWACCKIYSACWCMTIFGMNKMFYAFFICKEFRILALLEIKFLIKKKWSITVIYRNSLGNIAFGSDLNSIMKTAVTIQLFDAEIKHRNYRVPLWLQSQSLVGFTSLLKFWGS